MLSPDLAALYQLEPRALVQAVKRNAGRFPALKPLETLKS
jgi:hypothetical protein